MKASELRAVMDGVAMPVVVIGPDLRILIINQAALRVFSATLEGRHYITALRQPDLLHAIEQCLATGEGQDARYSAKDVSTNLVFQTHVRAFHDTDTDTDTDNDNAQDGGRGVVVSFEDVSQEEKIGQVRRDFVANVSHELKTPLTAIMGFVETLKGPAAQDAKASARFLSMMTTEADRMDALITDLLSLSRVESEARLRPDQTMDLSEVIRSCQDVLSGLAEGHGAQIDLVDIPQSLVMVGNGKQMTQVFINLLENAIKYGGGCVQVEAEMLDNVAVFRSAGVRINVRDNGKGIDPFHIPRLTERFYRVDSDRSQAKGGTGLGLAIVKHIVQRHRGRFQISSELGVGSTFSVTLPLLDPSSGA